MMALVDEASSGLDWEGLAYMFLAGLITLFIEYLRRRLPPPREKTTLLPSKEQ